MRDKIKDRILLQIQESQSNSIDESAIDGSNPSKETIQDSRISSLEIPERRLSLMAEQGDEFSEIRRDGTSVPSNGETSLIAFPHHVRAGRTVGVTEIRWSTGDGSKGQVYVSMEGGPETLFVTGAHGTKEAPWIQAGSCYEFRLYGGASDKRLLAQVSVIGLKLPAPQKPLGSLLDPPLLNLGFPIYGLNIQAATEISTDALRRSHLPEIRFEDRNGTALVSVCTMDYLHFARTLIDSVREHHASDEIAIYLLVVDWDGLEPLDIADAVTLSGQNIGIDHFDYMALKYSATELCCACKPYLIRYVMATTNYQKLLYLDSDIYVFDRLDYLLECLDEAAIVVIPHTLEPTPYRDRFHERPSLGDLIAAGTYNAGMFGLTVAPDNEQFISQWAELVTAPGAFLSDLGLQHEQQFFNWLVNLADRVKVIKDKAYNVAYWNLHDRSLRYAGWDLPEQKQLPFWQVDGQPLVAFHFSGFSMEAPYRLSAHDSRYNLYVLPSVTKLIEFYLDKLFEHGALEAPETGYRYDRFPSGLSITPNIREIFKKYETFLWRNLSPWGDDGERYYVQRLFLPVPQTSSLLPIALFQIYERRNDLQIKFPRAHLEPDPMLDWFSLRAIEEEPLLYEYFNCHRPTVPKVASVQTILDLRKEYQASFEKLDRPMSKDRTRLIRGFKDAGLETAAQKMFFTDDEYFALSPIYLLWKLVEDSDHLKATFPDLLFADASGFGEWLRQYGPSHFLDPDLADVFLEKAQGRSLARMFSFLNRTWDLACQWPLAMVGQNKEPCVRTLINLSQHGLDFDLDDVVMYLWTMAVKPWAGLPLAFELLVNACRRPSPLLPEGQEALLGPLLAEPGFREALNDYRSQANHNQLGVINARRYARSGSVMFGDARRDQQLQSGVNFFGYFKSPIGLGSLSRGLALALRSVGQRVQENIVGNLSMDPDLSPEDFIRAYDYSLGTNLFLSYPHLSERLLTRYPDHMVRDRKNIVYLAWEQRDGYPSWDRDYADFDQIWALSDFAARSFRRYMKRDDVVTVPAVIDFEAFPAAATKQDMGLDPDRFTFLYCFDANSSIERKNPEAAIEAFAQAFSANEKVQLLLKVSNSHRMDHRQKLRRLVNLAARSSLDIRFLFVDLPYADVLRMISAVDCYVSLHRAEGFGYTCAEAMAYAKPVIATNYSATTEFMDRESAFLVDYQECKVTVADGPFQRGSVWAEPSVEHAAAQMRRVYLNQRAAKKIGLAGEAKVRRLLSPERVGRIAAAALAGKTESKMFLTAEPAVLTSLLSLSEA